MNHKKTTQIIFSLLAIFAFVISCSDSGDSEEINSSPNSGSNCPTKTCGDFTTRAQAQAT